MAVRWYHARAGLGRSGWVGVVHPGFFFGVVLLAAKIQPRPEARELHLLELAGEVSEGFGDGRQGRGLRRHGLILDFGGIAGRSAGDHGHAAEGSAWGVVALELMFLDEGVFPEDQRRRAHGGRHYTKRLTGMQTDLMRLRHCLDPERAGS